MWTKKDEENEWMVAALQDCFTSLELWAVVTKTLGQSQEVGWSCESDWLPAQWWDNPGCTRTALWVPSAMQWAIFILWNWFSWIHLWSVLCSSCNCVTCSDAKLCTAQHGTTILETLAEWLPPNLFRHLKGILDSGQENKIGKSALLVCFKFCLILIFFSNEYFTSNWPWVQRTGFWY